MNKSPEIDSRTETSGSDSAQRVTRQKPRRRWVRILSVLFVIAILLAIGRATLPWVVRNYVNRTLDRNPLYAGRIGDVQIHLWRGAYSIHDIRISKTSGNIPVPLFKGKTIDFAIDWKSILHGKVVGRVLMDEPQINFVAATEQSEGQSGAAGPWLQMISDFFPFQINSAIIKNGSVHLHAYQAKHPVDVYVSKVEAMIDDLTNIRDETKPLVATVRADAMVMDQANFEFRMTLDPFSYRPTFHLAARLLGLDVTKINDLALAYGKFDFKRGWFDLVIEADAKEGQLSGYAKPLFRDLKVFSIDQDMKEDNVLQFFWQALVGATTRIFRNQARDQFGTLIPFSGDLSGATSTQLLAAIGNVLRNAFVRAYLPRLEQGPDEAGGLKFDAPQLFDPISAGDSP